MANALPILLLGGAAVLMLGGKKKGGTSKNGKAKGPTFSTDGSAGIIAGKDGSIVLGTRWRSQVLDIGLNNLWSSTFADAIDVGGTPFNEDGWGYKKDRAFADWDILVSGDYSSRVTFDKNEANYNRALVDALNKLQVTYNGVPLAINQLPVSEPVSELREKIMKMFEEWTKNKLRSICSKDNDCLLVL